MRKTTVKDLERILYLMNEDRCHEFSALAFLDEVDVGRILKDSWIEDFKSEEQMEQLDFSRIEKNREEVSIIEKTKDIKVYVFSFCDNHLMDGIIFSPQIPRDTIVGCIYLPKPNRNRCYLAFVYSNYKCQ